MAVHEMPLVVFTFLMQLAIGAFIAIEIVRVIESRRVGSAEANTALNKVEYVSFIVAAVGLLVSFFHLKVPMHAPYALTNFVTSWMTREIWMAVIFVTLLLVYCIVLLRKGHAKGLRLGLALCTTIAGLLLVFCMANAYMNEAHPAWNTPATPLMFYATVFLSGPAFAASVFSFFAVSDAKKVVGAEEALGAAQSGLVKFAAVVGMIALAVMSISTTLNLCGLGASEDLAALASVAALADEFSGLFVLRLILAFAGMLSVGCALYVNLVKGSARPYADAWITVACGLLLVAEFIGRNLFYASAMQIGF